MLKNLFRRLSAPMQLREAEKYLCAWCPKGVEVINDGHSCWLQYGGMIYSLDYQEPPAPENVPSLTKHLENHKWCMSLAGGAYTRRSLLESWVRKYLPDAHVVGASENDIVYPTEIQDRPLGKLPHTRFIVTHNGHFVFSITDKTRLPWLASQVLNKTQSLEQGQDIYFYPG